MTRAGLLWPRVLRLKGGDLRPLPSERDVLTSLLVYSFTPSPKFFQMSTLSLALINASL